MANRISVRNVDAGYGAVRVLHRLSIEVTEGETVVLLGTNGNGKSTLMKCIMGMVRPDTGEISLERDGQRIELVGKSPEEIVNLGITLVPEGRRLFPKLTVEENLVLGAYRTEARKDIERNLGFCFEAFPVLTQRKKQLAGSMRGAHLRRGRALHVALNLSAGPGALPARPPQHVRDLHRARRLVRVQPERHG